MTTSTIPLLIHLLAALLAGILLNLTPCVLPAIPIKIRTILRESGSTAGHRLIAALAFLGGTTTFFLALASLTAFLQWNWGTLFQSSVVIAVLVALLVGFAVITWLNVAIPVPAFAAHTRGHHYLEAYLSGLFSALLAAPCAGPFLGGVMVFAVAQPAMVIFLIFAAIGLGLAAPYVVLLLRPQLIERLPRSGPWSEAVRQGLALVLLAAAVFFAQSLIGRFVGQGLWWAWGALVGAWGLWQLRKDWASRSVAIVAMAGAAVLVQGAVVHPTEAQGSGIQWMAFSPARLEQAERQRRPVLIEFTADWCINCKVLEKTVYDSDAVTQSVNARNVLPLQVDLTRSDPRGEALLSHYGGHALPFAVVVNRQGKLTARFTGLFTSTALVESIQKAGENRGRAM